MFHVSGFRGSCNNKLPLYGISINEIKHLLHKYFRFINGFLLDIIFYKVSTVGGQYHVLVVGLYLVRMVELDQQLKIRVRCVTYVNDELLISKVVVIPVTGRGSLTDFRCPNSMMILA